MEKKIKIKLSQLNKAELSEREMNRLLGGDTCCSCGCFGPSGILDNGRANAVHGYEPVQEGVWYWINGN